MVSSKGKGALWANEAINYWPKRIPPSVPLRGNCLLPTGKDASQ